MRVADTLMFVCGDWQIQRSLTDHRTGTLGRFTGTASFAPVPGQPATLRYREQGELRFGRHAGPAWRELLWLAAPAGTADVRFADGRPFYPADFRTGRWQAEHRCGGDLYQVTYRVLGPGLLAQRWRARGPGKDYLSTSTLVRTGNAGSGWSAEPVDDERTVLNCHMRHCSQIDTSKPLQNGPVRRTMDVIAPPAQTSVAGKSMRRRQ